MAGSSMVVQGQVGYIDQGDPCGFLQNAPLSLLPLGCWYPQDGPLPLGKMGPVRAPVSLVPLPRLTPVVTHTRGMAGFTL